MSVEKTISRARDAARERSGDLQERNRLWWESLPMTYVGWEEKERVPTTPEEFRAVDRHFLRGNPWLESEFEFTAHAGERVLEIGCGAGSASCLFAQAGASMSAIDLTEQAVALAQANARSQGLDVDVRRMDAEKLAFDDASFDYVFSWGVIHHSRATETIVGEIARVLRPGGRGLVMVYNRHSVRYYLYGLFWLFARGKIFQGHSLASVQQFFTDGFYQRHFSPAELRDVFARAGLETERISLTHTVNPMLPGLPRALDAWLKRNAGWLLVIEFAKPAWRAATGRPSSGAGTRT
jgi:2-polyprenyl-3-methyl-5-hydroxy-6-metoxy-1,4-benzoquinol methylase